MKKAIHVECNTASGGIVHHKVDRLTSSSSSSSSSFFFFFFFSFQIVSGGRWWQAKRRKGQAVHVLSQRLGGLHPHQLLPVLHHLPTLHHHERPFRGPRTILTTALPSFLVFSPFPVWIKKVCELEFDFFR